MGKDATEEEEEESDCKLGIGEEKDGLNPSFKFKLFSI